MLPIAQRIAFLLFAVVTVTLSVRGFWRLYLRISQGRSDTDQRTNGLGRRIVYALRTTLTQSRVFRKRPFVSLFHAFIFYAFVLYLLVNFVDAIEGFTPLQISSRSPAGFAYNALSDSFSSLAILGVTALVLRRFLLPSQRDFRFNERTLLNGKVRAGAIKRDSLIVSAFILVHVGSRIVGTAARLAMEGPDRAQPFASHVSLLFVAHDPLAWRIAGYWGALGSILLFLVYFPYSKHVHLLMAPLKYLFRREVPSGELPAVKIDLDVAEPQLGAAHLQELAWPRLLDAYACIQCNRCQDVCPATQTGKALSPSALEINKRMALNTIAAEVSPFALTGTARFERGAAAGPALLQAVISAEAAWGCTTCGACLEVCPTQDEPMLDIIDLRRNLVMLQGEFPAQLQSAFRGMERAGNPWGMAREKRMDWAESLSVPTMEQVPDADVLYWVGCAASYDASAAKTARAVVQLLSEAGVKFAVLGKRESCTGDSARRAGNELLYQELAQGVIKTLNEVKPKLVIASCPHCVNTIGTEYPQLGGDFNVMHHSEYLDCLVHDGRLTPLPADATVTFHDPCYLGRHRGTYEQPRSVLKVLASDFVELERNRENAFCCGAGGAQFWKEEEPGDGRISENRFREVQQVLGAAAKEKVLAVGCPFCKSMLQSTPSAAADQSIVIRDVAELLFEGVLKNKAGNVTARSISGQQTSSPAELATKAAILEMPQDLSHKNRSPAEEEVAMDAKPSQEMATAPSNSTSLPVEDSPVVRTERRKWAPRTAALPPTKPLELNAESVPEPGISAEPSDSGGNEKASTVVRKKWQPKAKP